MAVTGHAGVGHHFASCPCAHPRYIQMFHHYRAVRGRRRRGQLVDGVLPDVGHPGVRSPQVVPVSFQFRLRPWRRAD